MYGRRPDKVLLMKQTKKISICSVFAALSIVLMFSTALLPVSTYALPAFAGLLTTVIVIEIDKKWAFGIYVTVSLLSAFLVPDKEAAAMYIAFFGYYPIIKSVFEKHLPRIAEYILKFLVFNAAMVGAYCFLFFILGMPIDEYGELGKFAIPILLGLGNVFFLVFDFALTKLITVYIHVWSRRFRKFFR